MKKAVILLLLLSGSFLFAQRNTGSIKAGYFKPGATGGGFLLGYQSSRQIDDYFEIGWSLDWFNKNYVDRELAEQFREFNRGINGEVNELRAKTNLHDIPALLNVSFFQRTGPRTKVFINGGIGVELLLVFYRDYVSPDEDDLKGAFDFTWRTSVGALYELGRRSDIVAEAGYHNSDPGWTYTIEDEGRKRTFERRYDMSGLFFRLGVRFFY